MRVHYSGHNNRVRDSPPSIWQGINAYRESTMTAMAAKPTDAFIDELEEIRSEWQNTARPRRSQRTREEAAAAKRRSLRGGSNNHTFTGEQYLNCTDKGLRRIQLQKMMDEGGQTNFGGPIPCHIELARWEANAYGLSNEEITQLERDDQAPEELITGGWRIATARHQPFPITSGLSYEGEGGRYVESLHSPEKIAARLAALRQQFEAWGVEDIDRAMA